MAPETLLIFGAAGLLALVVAAQNWRHALLMVIILGFSQDAIRKLTPGEPVAIIMLSSVMVAVAVLIATARFGMINLRPLTQGNRTTLIVLTAFIALVFAQAIMSFVRFRSVVVPAIGVLSYLSPIPAIWLIYRWARHIGDYERFFRVYVICGLAVAISLLVEKAGVHSVLFEEVGEGLIIYDRQIGILETYNGFMRSGEVAAWHLGATSAFLIVLAVTFKRTVLRWATPVLVIGLLTVATLTGRRKVLIMVAAFAVIYFLLLMYYRQRSGIRAMAVTIAAVSILLAGTLATAPESSRYDPYIGRGKTVFGDAADRFQQLGLGSMSWAIQAAGPWGLGAGSVSQGTQHFGGADDAVRGSAEGGLGKIIVELGVLGFVLASLSVLLIARSLRSALAVVAKTDAAIVRLNLGLLAFVAGNVPIFAGASQIYGDPFVLFMLGSCLGFVLAGPRLIELRARAKARQAGLERKLAAELGDLPQPFPAAQR